MKPKLIDRIRQWLCSKVGHAKPVPRWVPWEFKGRMHYVCPRCRCIKDLPTKFSTNTDKG